MNEKLMVTTAMGLIGYPVLSLYADGSTRLDLRDAFDHSPLATCTANCVAYVEPDCIVVKDYSENEGMANALYDAGVVTGTVKMLEANQWGMEYPVMRLNPDLVSEVNRMRFAWIASEEEEA